MHGRNQQTAKQKNIIVILMLISMTVLIGCEIREGHSEDIQQQVSDDTTTELQIQDEKTVNIQGIVDIIEEGLENYELYREEDEEWIIYQCETSDELNDSDEKNSTISISKNFEGKQYDYKEAKDFLYKMIDYDTVRHYQEPDNIYGITEIFGGCKDNESYYLIYCGEDSYLIHIQGSLHLEYELLSWEGRSEIANQYTRQIIECTNEKKNKIISDISYLQDTITYELYFDQQEKAEYTAVIRMDDEAKIKYMFTLYQDQKEIQKLEWEAFRINPPEFQDVNGDGYVDMVVVTGEAPSYDIHEIYLWNNEESNFVKVHYDGILAWIEMKDGYIWNWIRNGEGYILETLKWDGTELILISEEKVVPSD